MPRRDLSLYRVTRWPTARALSRCTRGCVGHRYARQRGGVPGATPQRSPAPRRARLGGGRPLGHGSPGSLSWEVLHHTTNTKATLCEQLQQSGSRRALKLQQEDMCIALAPHSFCFGLPEVTAVCGLRAFGQAEPSRAHKQAETRSNAVLPRKESE